MLEYKIKSKVQSVGEHKGLTVYFAQLKPQHKLSYKALVDCIVRETSLSEDDMRNALISLRNVVCEALRLGASEDLVELGSFRVVVPSKMMNSLEEVTVKGALKTPRIVFTPKQKMRDTANAVELSIDRSTVTKAGTTTGTPSDNDELDNNPFR